MDERLEKIQKSSYLLPDPGGEVVRELVDEVDRLQGAATAWFNKARDRDTEIRRLRLAISRQKMYLSKKIDDLLGLMQNEREGSYRHEDLRDQHALLVDILGANHQTAKELKLDERVHTEPTEYTEEGVPMLPIPDFCTRYECVQKSYRANYEGGKYNCIGDETRRLVKNEGGFLTCPTCHYSWGEE